MTEPIPAFPALSGLREIAAQVGADTEFSRNVGFLERAIHENSPTAFDFARSLLEMTCKTILRDRGEEPNERSDAPELFRTTLKAVRLLPDGADNGPHEGLTQTIRGLQQSVQGLSELRNRAGSASHGRDAYSRSLDAVHIRLAAHAADVIIHFLACRPGRPASRLHVGRASSTIILTSFGRSQYSTMCSRQADLFN